MMRPMQVGHVQKAWTAELEAAGIAIDAAVAEHWLRLLAGAEPGREELAGLVALYARSLGEEGRPASLSVRQLTELIRVLSMHGEPTEAVEALLVVAADAHSLGSVSRLEHRRVEFLRTRLPVFELPGGRVLAFALDPLNGELLDVLVGRAFTLAAGSGCGEVIFELSAVEDLDERLLLDTFATFPRHELADEVRLVLSGVPEPEAWSRKLERRGVPGGLIRCLSSLVDAELLRPLTDLHKR